MPAGLAAALCTGLWLGATGLSAEGRIALGTFGTAVILWIGSRLDKTFVALAVLVAGTAFGQGASEGAVLSSFGDGMIALLLAAFVLAAAITASGLAARCSGLLLRRARSLRQVVYGMTAGMIALALVMPATSGRAALLLPVFLAVAAQIPNPRITKALALLIPTVVLLSSAGSLIGAGGNVLAADTILHLEGERIGYLRWLMLGLPFALLSCFGAAWAILRLFLNAEERRQGLDLAAAPDDPPRSRLSPRERFVLTVAFALVLLWCSETIHGLDNATVALLGALAVTAPRFGVLTFKQAVKGVDWNLLVFMAACLQLGDALVRSGGAAWVIEGLFDSASGDRGALPTFATLAVGLGLLSHLVVTSRTARVSILVPMVLPLAAALGHNAAAFGFILAVATGYCLTLPVSAKPLAMMSELDAPTFDARDLLKLSAVLLPFHAVLLLVFSFWIWPSLGLPLTGDL
ncbi:MAG: anion permease [Kiloniellales bacterium]|nr:anion permease [Kiloniellales bacterium]